MWYALLLFGLLTAVQGVEATDPFSGVWLSNFSKSKLPSDYQFKEVTLQFAVVFDSVTIGSKIVTRSGQELTSTELFHMDGKEHPGTLGPGVTHTARWVNASLIEAAAKKDGKDLGWETFEVSPNGRTLTFKISAQPEQVLVFDRQK